MKYALLLLAPIGVFITVAIARWFIEFCDDHSDRWWGGLPLWMTGAMCVLAPMFLVSLMVPVALVATLP